MGRIQKTAQGNGLAIFLETDEERQKFRELFCAEEPLHPKEPIPFEKVNDCMRNLTCEPGVYFTVNVLYHSSVRDSEGKILAYIFLSIPEEKGA